MSEKIEQNEQGVLQALNKEEGYVLKLLQGYLWYPIEEDIDLGKYLPKELDGEIHLLWDKITPPFTFFDNGTLASTQNVFQFTVVKVNKENVEIEEVGGILPWLADVIQEKLNTTPEGVGWQIMEDLRPI